MSETGPFTILDVETTGLFPHYHDRIVEIGILQINASGDVLGTYESLINPKRDIGPTSIHGITAREALRAPSFHEIAADIIPYLRNSIVVAHNAQFDLNFIRSDFRHIGVTIPRLPSICTMRLAMHVDPQAPCRKLGALCKHFGIALRRQHSAMDDAKAAAGLFLTCLHHIREKGESLAEYFMPFKDNDDGAATWPCLKRSRDPYPRDMAIREIDSEPSYISQLIERLPANAATQDIQCYFALLDRVLEDRRITQEEQTALFELAKDHGLSRNSVTQAHREYLRDLLRLALEDGFITDAENKDIDDVRHLLAISDDEFCEILHELKNEKNSASPLGQRICQPDMTGKTVCFTGELHCSYQGKAISRATAQQFATSKGMMVSPSVTRKVDFLVCADPDSMSGKAKKARQYGTRILAEAVFWKMLGINVD